MFWSKSESFDFPKNYDFDFVTSHVRLWAVVKLKAIEQDGSCNILHKVIVKKILLEIDFRL